MKKRKNFNRSFKLESRSSAHRNFKSIKRAELNILILTTRELSSLTVSYTRNWRNYHSRAMVLKQQNTIISHVLRVDISIRGATQDHRVSHYTDSCSAWMEPNDMRVVLEAVIKRVNISKEDSYTYHTSNILSNCWRSNLFFVEMKRQGSAAAFAVFRSMGVD